jgi:hypothetical protein
MIKYFLFLIITFNFLQSETFQERQIILQDIKNIVQFEESFARTYEQYILTNYKLPPTVGTITTLMGGDIKSFVTIDDKVNLTTLTTGLPKISYALGDILKADLSIKSLYEGDTFRRRTYVRDGSVYFILEDSFAKHLFDLIKLNNSSNEIKDCSSSNSDKACKRDNHIYIDATGVTATTIASYLMSYHVDKFKTGPIVVTNNSAKYTTEDVFKSIPKGALIYDIDGVKYVKTTTTLEELK